MELTSLIRALAEPSAYPFPVAGVAVRQTHISAVFLAGPFAYKVKKPVNPGFLDFSTLEKRHRFCGEEVRLNRRLAPDVYLGVVPVVRSGGGLRVEGAGEPVEWAVKMRRLPEGVTLHERLPRDEVGLALVEALARKIADFHRRSPAPDAFRAESRFDVVAGNVREVFETARPSVGTAVSTAVYGRVRELVEGALARLRPLIDDRAARGLTRDAHGDLHLDHVCFFPERAPPDDLVCIDCIEFSERFRFIDPVADVAFAAMDLAFHGRRDLARAFAEAYFAAAGDEEGRPLLPLFTAYRAAVRGAVDGLKCAEPEVPPAEHDAALESARGHWLLALGELEEPARRPALLLVGGLQGSGKSTLSRALAERGGFAHLRTDEIRKELAGVPPGRRLGEEFYSPEWNERTYAECLSRAGRRLYEGGRVLIDATFADEGRRRLFLDAATRWGVPPLWLLCRAEPEVVRRRLEQRRGDVSDADWAVYQGAAARWEEPGGATRRATAIIPTDGTPAEALQRAARALRDAGLG
ncbi:MAG TPA: AAA family ATPase [Gemmataceae bacterium]|nr:AAA family ATPase [Gemmataceae bacterium]